MLTFTGRECEAPYREDSHVMGSDPRHLKLDEEQEQEQEQEREQEQEQEQEQEGE